MQAPVGCSLFIVRAAMQAICYQTFNFNFFFYAHSKCLQYYCFECFHEICSEFPFGFLKLAVYYYIHMVHMRSVAHRITQWG